MNRLFVRGAALALALLGGIVPAVSVSASAAAEPALPRVESGRFVRLGPLGGPPLAPRLVDVWVSEGCSAERRCPVLYMHDGQMLFDPGTTWNKQAWNVATTATRLVREGRLAGLVVVGVWNSGSGRFADYFPQKFIPHIADEAARRTLLERGIVLAPRSDAYLRFLVEELKPRIDREFPTRPERAHTAVMGASMGGLISIYAALEHPQVFGAAAGVSTHWIGGFERNEPIPAAAVAYLRERLPAPGTLRLWMDRGTTQLDAQYDKAQERIDAAFAARGWRPGAEYQTRVFEGTGHNETDWAARLDQVLLFLFGARP
jgi:enterochelin esterase-like enzyme